MRTHLLTGPGGAGVSSVAAALAVALDRQASTVTLACLGDDGSLTRLLGVDAPLRVLDLAAPRDWSKPDLLLAATVERFGGDGDVAEEWRHLPGADDVAALIALGEAVAATDILVVDLSDLRRAARLLAASVRLPWVLRGLLGLQAVGARVVGPDASHAVPRWLDALEAAADVLRAPDTRLHLVRGSTALEAAKVRRGAPALLLSGVAPGVVIGTPSVPGHPGDGAGSDTGTAGRSGDGVPEGTSYDWAPFETAELTTWPASASGALRIDAADAMTAVLKALQAVPPVAPAVSRIDDHLRWRLPLPWLRAEDVQVLSRGEDVVVRVRGVPHLIRPPAVVRRCVPVRGRLDGSTLELEARLREGAWRGDG